MRRLVLALAISTLGLLAVPATGPTAVSCGLPEAQPVWIDFTDASVSFWRERFARPGVIIATGGPKLAAEARDAGAGTVHWDMHLRKRVGTPSSPADPSLIVERADSLFDYAVGVTGCQQPLIALNELWGASLPTPLTPTAERYRANVLRFLQRLSERGGRPALLISSEPFTGGDAAAWWQAVGKVSDLVLEKYANANVIWRDGAVDGSRRLRTSYRTSIAKLLAIGIPPSRIGLMIGFQTGPGTGGREGLKPRSRWFDVAKWQALAAKQVAREFRLPHVWSWGWAQRNERSADPDKTYAACVWLWARDSGLCDAPDVLGKELDPDVQTGQINLPSGVRCVYGEEAVTASSVAALAKVTRDRELAMTALVMRLVERERTDVETAEIVAVERNIIAARFGGSRAAYRSALAKVGASVGVARGIIGDELRHREISRGLTVNGPSRSDVDRFRATFAAVAARPVVVSPAPSWLPKGRGLALATSAPEAVFTIPTKKRATVRTAEGRFTVTPLEDAAPLATFTSSLVRPAVVDALRAALRVSAYADWSIRKQKEAESRLACERDRMPELAVVSLTAFAPFLSLHELRAASWDASRASGDSGG